MGKAGAAVADLLMGLLLAATVPLAASAALHHYLRWNDDMVTLFVVMPLVAILLGRALIRFSRALPR